LEGASPAAGGEGWILAGDALVSAAPPFWPGLNFALESGAQAADVAIAGLRAGDLSASRLGGWGAGALRGWNFVRGLVRALDAHDGNLARFLESHPSRSKSLAAFFAGQVVGADADLLYSDFDRWQATNAAENDAGDSQAQVVPSRTTR
jgi:hypothetical protein